MSTKARLDPRGNEIPDPTPMAIPVGFHHPPSLEDRMKRYIRTEFSNYAQNSGHETFEEADDFDIPDDPVDPHTPWEVVFDPAVGKDVTLIEKQHLDADRETFNAYVAEEKKKKKQFDAFSKKMASKKPKKEPESPDEDTEK